MALDHLSSFVSYICEVCFSIALLLLLEGVCRNVAIVSVSLCSLTDYSQ